MLNSIIVPFFEVGISQEWSSYLHLCTRAIARSAELCQRTDYEIVVVSGRKPPRLELHGQHRIVCAPFFPAGKPNQLIFNKCALLNAGVKNAAGNVLTFIDADAVVGPRFLEAADVLVSDPTLTKICYRVRKMPDRRLPRLKKYFNHRYAHIFAHYDRYTIAPEAYEEAHLLWAQAGEPVFGNSHFSITRKALGALQWPENFLDGRMEDVYVNFQIAAIHGEKYKAAICTDSAHGILCIEHPRSVAHWNNHQTVRNNEHYWRQYRLRDENKRSNVKKPCKRF